MNIFKMQGAWSPLMAAVYNAVVAPAMMEIYEQQAGKYLAEDLIRPGMRLLDVGCGMGDALGIVARRHPDISLTGVDLSERMIAKARQKHGRVPNLCFRQGDALALPFEPETFDAAISMASIKHWPDQAKGLSEIHRVLKPSGRVLVMEADRNCSREAALNFVRRWRWVADIASPLVTEYFMHIVAGQGISAGELQSLFERAAFEQVEVETMTEYPAVVARGIKPG